MPKYVQPSDRLRREGKNVVTRLETILRKLEVLLDKEWDDMGYVDQIKIVEFRRELERMVTKYK